MNIRGIILAGAVVAAGLSTGAAAQTRTNPMSRDNLMLVCKDYISVGAMAANNAALQQLSPEDMDALQVGKLQNAMRKHGVPLTEYNSVDYVCGFYLNGASDVTTWMVQEMAKPGNTVTASK